MGQLECWRPLVLYWPHIWNTLPRFWTSCAAMAIEDMKVMSSVCEHVLQCTDVYAGGVRPVEHHVLVPCGSRGGPTTVPESI